MKVTYNKHPKISNLTIDYYIGLSKQEIQSLDIPPHSINGVLSPNTNKEIKREFQLRKSITDDDSNFELHYHPGGRKWNRVIDIHATMSEEAYVQLKSTGKYEGEHDHGLISIVQE